uniref:Putative secreted protein n=1 Tax=Panstrongylus lignarius TaxID=156445 RepID=A0A224XXI5_9HEMI
MDLLWQPPDLWILLWPSPILSVLLDLGILRERESWVKLTGISYSSPKRRNLSHTTLLTDTIRANTVPSFSSS